MDTTSSCYALQRKLNLIETRQLVLDRLVAIRSERKKRTVAEAVTANDRAPSTTGNWCRMSEVEQCKKQNTS